MSIDPNLVRAGSYAEIGSILARDVGVLIDRWAHRAAQEQPNAQRVHHVTLLNHLPGLLRAIGAALIEDDPAEEGEHHRLAVVHGEQRWDVGWSLPEVVRDYQILRLVVVDYLEETLDRPLAYREVMAIGLAFDEAITASVTEFVAQRNAQLREVETALREADRRKNEFLATLAHELRNPLAPLRNGVELLRRITSIDPTVAEVHGLFDRQVGQLTRLVEDLLDVTRIAQGKLQLRPERVDAAAILRRAVQTSEPLLTARRHRLDLETPPTPLWVKVDPSRLVQVVANLLNNAAKYTEPGGHIRLTVERVGDDAVIRVRDNGSGITPDLLPRVFDMFTQAEWLPERSEGGLGIGLSLVRRLVEMSGGRVTAHSDGAGRGSEFVVTLPLCAVESSEQTTEATPKKPVASSRHVLIVEDHADGRESLAILLRLWRHRVDVAENGTRGVERALAVRPEVALIDLELPDIDGCEVARQVRKALGNAVRLVAVTGSGQPEDRERCLLAGFDHHLVKPVDPALLQTMLADPSI